MSKYIKAVIIFSFFMLLNGQISAATVTIFTAGIDDLYQNGTEPANPSPGAIAAAGNPMKSFDSRTLNRAVAFLFDLSSISPAETITSATLEFRARPIDSVGNDNVNDSVLLRFYNNDGSLQDPDGNLLTDSNWSSKFGPSGSAPNFLQGNPWNQTNQPADGLLFNLDLSMLPRTTGDINLIPDLDAARFLDVLISDDTEVDFMRLTITSTVVPVPAAIWLMSSGLLLLIGYRKKATV